MPKVQVNQITSQTGGVLTVGQSGDTVTLAAGATSSGFGRTGTVNWSSTIQTTGFTASSPNGYFCNTTSSAFTVTLPSSATSGDIVAFADYAQTFNTNNLTLNPNGLKIEGATTNVILSTQGASVTLVYSDSTKGWIIVSSAQVSELPRPTFISATGGTVLTCGNYKTHVFTGSGCFVVTCAGNSYGSNSVEYMVVAGGGSGGTSPFSTNESGGGGAGGFRQNYPSPSTTGLPVTATTYPITVGAGGALNPSAGNGNQGSNSIFSTITSAGGGYGSNYPSGGGGPGGSGGGAGNGTGGTGNTPPVSPSQGNPGGGGGGHSGGGGGIGASGGSISPTVAAVGGIGSSIATTFFGPTAPSYGTTGPAPGRYFAGGGGAGGYGVPGPLNAGGIGGSGGGGNGGEYLASGPFPPGNAIPGTTNTGAGGGGGSNCNQGPGNVKRGGSGGSGIVVIRYQYQ